MATRRSRDSCRIACLVLVTCLLVVGGTASTGPVLAVQAENGTASETTTGSASPTATDAGCLPSESGPSFQTSRLFASDRTVSTDSPGQVDAGFQIDPTAACPVVVNVTFSTSSGVTLDGGANVTRLADGSVQTQLTIEPGSSAGVSVDVYPDGTGRTVVSGNVEYWPEGHPDRSKQIEGLRVPLSRATVTETTTETATQTTTSGTGPVLSTTTVVGLLLALLVGIRMRP